MNTATLVAAATPSGDPLTAALAAAERGWHVFPLHPDSKRPAVRDWEDRATTAPDRIRRCWGAGPYGIGIACGPSGLIVVDLDTPTADDTRTRQPEWDMLGITDGLDVFTVLAQRSGAGWPTTYTVRTPSGGIHLYFTAPARLGLRNTQGRLGWKVDTRAAGGYVVGAGSTVGGDRYTLIDDREPVVLPGWLADPLRPPAAPPPAVPALSDASRGDAYVAAAVRGEVQRVQAAPRGQHNHSLYIAACALGQLVAGGQLARGDATAALQDAAADHIGSQCGCTAREVDATIASGLRGGQSRPRRPGAAA